MSTLSGNASKGEKTKPKFQSLDINSLYKISRGENTEKPAQKSSSNYIKHGMQSLGKVPNARRAPANLPSLKSEHIDSGAAVPLVPPGATGWGKQEQQGGSQPPNVQQNGAPPTQGAPPPVQGPPQLTPHQQAIAIPSTNVIPPHTKQTPPPAPVAVTSGGDKLWSAVMAGGQPEGHPPAYQSPQFQHEFPSLSAGDGVGGVGPRPAGESTAGGPAGASQSGLSLRPQTEGSWTQGGQRAPDGSVRSGSVPPGAPPQLAGPGGRPAEMLPPQMRGVLPPFMYKGSFPQGGPPAGPANHPHPQMPSSAPHNGRRAADGRPPRLQDRDAPAEEVALRPIIREEELSKLDEFGQDMGWATSDDIDYNQKLAFSDDEDRPSKKEYKQAMAHHQQHALQHQPHAPQHQPHAPQHQPHAPQHQPHAPQHQPHAPQHQPHAPQHQPHAPQHQPHAQQHQPHVQQQHHQHTQQNQQHSQQNQQHSQQNQQHPQQNQQHPQQNQQHPQQSQQHPQQHAPQHQPHASQHQPHAQQHQQHASQHQPHAQQQHVPQHQPHAQEPQQPPHSAQQQSHTPQQQTHQQTHHQQSPPQSKSQDARSERQTPPKHWNTPRPENYRGRQSDEDDVMAQKHRQHQKEVDLAIQRAKQRKEEEEKRFSEESRQRAQKKLQELNEKVREKRDRDRESEIGTISPSAVPPKPINHVEIPLPEFQKDKEKDQRPRATNEAPPPKEDASGFRQMTQIEGKSFSRKPQQQKPSDRDHRDPNPSFSRHFQSDLPPRFLKHQQRNNSTPQNPQQSGYSHYDSNRWSANAPRAPSRGGRPESPERHDDERREYKRQSSEDSYRSHHSQSEKSSDIRFSEDPYHKKDKEQDKWQNEKVEIRYDRKPDTQERYYEDRRSQEKIPDRFERPQRPDSRDSHTSHTSHTSHGSQGSNRRSRDSDLKESMGSWNEDVEAAYEEKKEKERLKEEKRTVPALVPGPITRDRIEADDFNEKRNLTQLKKGEMPPPKKSEVLKKDDKIHSNEKLAWGEISITTVDPEPRKEQETKVIEVKKPQAVAQDDYKDRQTRNNRNFSQTKSWGNTTSSSTDFHSRGSSSWGNNKRPPSRGHKSGGRDFYGHGTDSDGSTETYSVDSKDAKVAPKKPQDKDDKNRENKQERSVTDQKRQQQDKIDKKEGSGYVPRGEPSRHGRGGGNNFRGTRMGGMGKRIDGYGPPPSKSPFGHHDDKDKRVSSEDTASETTPAPTSSTTDKIKQNQEALAAGIIGKSRQEPLEDKNKTKPKPENRRNKSNGRRDEQDGDLSDNSKRQPLSRSSSQRGVQSGDRRGPGIGDRRDRNNPPPRMGSDKRGAFDSNPIKKLDAKPDPQNLLASAIADISLKNREDDLKDQKDSNNDLNGDSEGFQEVKSKKTAKDRPKPLEEKKGPPPRIENKDIKQEKKPAGLPGKPISAQQMTPQQIQNIPSLMSTPVNPPQMLPMSKNQYDQRPNNRQNKLAPRFAKQKMQKQMQQMMNDVGDITKAPPTAHVYGMRDSAQTVPPVTCSAWDKPLGSQLRAVEHDASGMLGLSIEGVNMETGAPSPGHGASPGSDKVLGKTCQIPDKSLLDGSTPPVNTIIFENTNYKSGPVRSASRNSVPGGPNDKPRPNEHMDNNVYGKPINDLLQKTDASGKVDPIQMQSVFKEETDMKLDFFGADLTHLTDDKSTKNLCMSKSITSVNSTICNADSLNLKIASVKKVWETSEQETEDTSGISFGAPLDSAFKGSDAQDEVHHEGYSPGGNQAASTTNVCKVKPTQQVSMATGQTISSVSQQPHSAMVGHAMLLGTPLSPPPLAAAAVGVSLGPQGYATNQHLTGFQTAAAAQGVATAGSAQYGISAIPSPPTVLYNSAQQLQSGLYGAFMPTADQAGVLGGQGHARTGGFGQYPAAGAYHSLGQPTNYNTQSVYLPTAPHPPPTAQAPPELYPSMNSFRLSAAGPFGQNQALNNPTTVLISSTSNSLMSASVKPSSQPISAIGTKAGGVGQAYQQQSQQGQQVYMTYEPALQAANYLQGAGVMQRGPAGPQVQNSVVPGLQPSSSYYSGSTGAQTGYYQQPGSSSLPSGPQMSQHQAGYGLQGNVFGTHTQSHTNTGLQGSFPFLSSQMQVAAALSAQQYRSAAAASLQNPYLKNVGGAGQQMSGDQQAQQTSGGQRPQQLKSPSSQEVLSSVFNSVPQIPSPKSRQPSKHMPQQSSPTTQRKYNFYQGVGSQQNNIQQRYPTPIQRPINFQQQNINSMQSNGPNNQKHNNRNNPNKAPNRQYYGGQSSTLPSNQTDKSDDSKVPDATATKTANVTDLSKDNIKENTPVLKE